MADICYEWQELRPKLGDLICHIDGKVASLEALEKKIQEKKDESYLNGLEDMRNAVLAITRCVENGGMSVQDLIDAFGQTFYMNILEGYTAKEIIDKVNQWKNNKSEQENQFQVGDEVVIVDQNLFSYGTTQIVTRIDHPLNSTQQIFVFNKSTGLVTRLSPDCLRKTGNHFQYILLPKEEIDE